MWHHVHSLESLWSCDEPHGVVTSRYGSPSARMTLYETYSPHPDTHGIIRASMRRPHISDSDALLFCQSVSCSWTGIRHRRCASSECICLAQGVKAVKSVSSLCEEVVHISMRATRSRSHVPDIAHVERESKVRGPALMGAPIPRTR